MSSRGRRPPASSRRELGQRPGGAAALAPKISLGLLLIAAAAQYTWNAFTVTPLAGYDAGGHAGYLLTIVEEGRLPHPLEGWATFHPPLYYLIGAGVWKALEPLGPAALVGGLRLISALALLAVGWATFGLVLRRYHDWPLASLSAALVLFLPASALAAAMIGNEALGAAWAALAVPFLLALQEEPRRPGCAAMAGLLAGLALATKYTGFFVAAACVVPFLRLDFDRRMAQSLAACILVGAAVTLPTYVRNLAETGSPIPMTRELEPMRSLEQMFVFRERRVADYFRFSSGSIARPYIFYIPAEGNPVEINHAMHGVWGLLYASLWYDVFAHRIPLSTHRDDVWQGPLLASLGLVPTAILLLGLFGAGAEAVRTRGRSCDAPLVVMSLIALVAFVWFTWRAPALVAVKGSYLLPLLAPAGLFFARGARRLPGVLRAPALAVCALAALAAALVFTNELFFPPEVGFSEAWWGFGKTLPGTHIVDAVERLAPPS